MRRIGASSWFPRTNSLTEEEASATIGCELNGSQPFFFLAAISGTGRELHSRSGWLLRESYRRDGPCLLDAQTLIDDSYLMAKK